MACAALLALGAFWPGVAALGCGLLAALAATALEALKAWRDGLAVVAMLARLDALEAHIAAHEKRLQAAEGMAALNSLR
jgi:hypothetical protein